MVTVTEVRSARAWEILVDLCGSVSEYSQRLRETIQYASKSLLGKAIDDQADITLYPVETWRDHQLDVILIVTIWDDQIRLDDQSVARQIEALILRELFNGISENIRVEVMILPATATEQQELI